jgi:hypothetical protein
MTSYRSHCDISFHDVISAVKRLSGIPVSCESVVYGTHLILMSPLQHGGRILLNGRSYYTLRDITYLFAKLWLKVKISAEAVESFVTSGYY